VPKVSGSSGPTSESVSCSSKAAEEIDGSFLAAGVIDELSLLFAPVADGSIGTPSLFDATKAPGQLGT
jgi:hypothetical protein